MQHGFSTELLFMNLNSKWILYTGNSKTNLSLNCIACKNNTKLTQKNKSSRTIDSNENKLIVPLEVNPIDMMADLSKLRTISHTC